ncbi:MAG: GGDEF domain-containing phosphodiesterase [Meiothermus sp.]|nr:GGDEF domain-containing phosphodiesterase [Meiothermus sp.]
MNEVSWKLFAPLSIEGSTLLIEHQDLPEGMAVRLGGVGGVVLKPQEAQELLLNLLTGESWVSSRLVWAAPRLHINQRGYNLNERAKLALIEALQSLLVESQGVAVNPMPKESWQRSVLEIAQLHFSTPEEALPKLGEILIGLGLKGVGLWLRGENERTLKLVGLYPEGPAPAESFSPERHPVYYQVLERNLIVAAEDARQDARMVELREVLQARGLGAVLQVVMHNENGLRGVVWLESLQPRRWNASDESLGLAIVQVIERILRPLQEAPKLPTSPERKSLTVKRADFEVNLTQAVALAQRHERTMSLMRIRVEGITKAQTETAAREIAHTLRQSDSLSYLGDSGFALLLSEVRFTAGASRVAHRLLQRLRAALPGTKVGIGIAMYPQDSTTVEGLWAQAEQACHSALEGGGIRLLTPGAVELQEAIAHNDLTLHFQPVFDLRDLELVSVEALARWPKPKGMHQAGDFIPLAEQVGLMSAQDKWAMERVLEQAALWKPSGVNARFSVNISSEILIDPNFPTYLQEMLSARSLPADILILEMREESILADFDTTGRSLEILKHLGVGIALDNFGTNPLPLTQLKRLPLDWIKMAPALSSSENAGLAKAAIEMIHAVGTKAVAKGLEEQSQLNRMKELGADYGQGHILGWPVPSEDLGALLVWGIGS